MAVTYPIRPVSPRVLRALLRDTRVNDPRDEPIAPLGEHGYSSAFGGRSAYQALADG